MFSTRAESKLINFQLILHLNSRKNFDSALAEHIYDHPNHTILFSQASLISQDQGIVQHYKGALKIYTYQNLGLALIRDSGDFRISDSYLSFLKREANTLVIHG